MSVFNSASIAAQLKTSKHRVLICFSHLRWDFVYQRPQHLMSRAVADSHVIFIEEPVFERDAAPSLKLSARDSGVVVAVPTLPQEMRKAEQLSAQRLLVRKLLERLSAEHTCVQVVHWYYTPMALAFSHTFPCDLVVYDCMDELSGFRGAPPDLLDWERKLFDRADLVFTGGRSLYEAKRLQHSHTHLFPSSIDRFHFAQALTFRGPEPADQAGIPHPRLGYFGVVDERMDLDLVGAIADLRKTWQFVMLGPVVKIDPGVLPRRPNLHWLGPKSYAELPSYLAGWEIGLMPFALNDATRFISPTKTPEFLAAGLRVISTPIADVVRSYGERGHVCIAATPEDIVLAAETMLGSDPTDWRQAANAFLAGMSWDLTWAGMHSLLDERSAFRSSSSLRQSGVSFEQGAVSV
jgi:hypothetical protein